MVEYRYSIADLLFDVQADCAFSPAEDQVFRLGDPLALPRGEPISVFCGINSELCAPPEISLEDIAYLKNENQYFIYLRDAKGALSHEVRAKEGFGQVSVTSSFRQKVPFEGSVGEVLFRTAILFHNGIVVHSAAINCNGTGIIFSAPSGTGKSTQANLWRQYKGAAILNGDRPALRLIDETVYVYGTLWSGSSPDFQNAKAPLKAIVMLEQAEQNSLRPLTPEEAVRYLLPRIYLPYGLEDLLEKAVDNADAIIRRVPVCLLKCRPDFEAVEIVSQWLNM